MQTLGPYSNIPKSSSRLGPSSLYFPGKAPFALLGVHRGQVRPGFCGHRAHKTQAVGAGRAVNAYGGRSGSRRGGWFPRERDSQVEAQRKSGE